MESFDIMKYIEMALRRKYWIIIPFLLSLLGGLHHILITPEIFEAKTLILVQPQKVPSSFVRSIVSSGVEERLKTITQQVTSRTNLETIIKEYQLYTGKKMILEDKVGLVRGRIRINVGRGGKGGNSFEIVFRGEDPKKVMQVTNALSSKFISENLKIRESQALGTSAFLADELEAIRKRLSKKEGQLTEYRQKFMGAMPEQLQTNLNLLGRLQMQLEQLHSNLRDGENRKLIIQQQIGDSEMRQKQIADAGMGTSLTEKELSSTSEEEGSEDLVALRKQLALLKSRYTDNHPDVRRLKKVIEKIEEGESESEEVEEFSSGPEVDGSEADLTDIEPILPMMDDFLKPQLQQIDNESKKNRAKIQEIQSKIETIQKRVEETPKRELELITVKRDYGNLKTLYSSMLNRKLEAELAVSMEKKQKGEQFRVVDPAKIPVKPVEPDARKIILLTLILGLGLGGGLAYLLEFMDTSYKTPDDVEKELQMPVLVNIPIRYTAKELKRQFRKKVLMAASVAVGFILSASGIVIAVKGVDATLLFIKSYIDKL